MLLIGLALRGGEYAIGAHLWLSVTGLPSALLSLWLPSASIPGIVGAAMLGLLQWVAIAQTFSWWDQRGTHA